MSAAAVSGQWFISSHGKEFGALVFAATMNVRKVVSILTDSEILRSQEMLRSQLQDPERCHMAHSWFSIQDPVKRTFGPFHFHGLALSGHDIFTVEPECLHHLDAGFGQLSSPRSLLALSTSPRRWFRMGSVRTGCRPWATTVASGTGSVMVHIPRRARVPSCSDAGSGQLSSPR